MYQPCIFESKNWLNLLCQKMDCMLKAFLIWLVHIQIYKLFKPNAKFYTGQHRRQWSGNTLSGDTFQCLFFKKYKGNKLCEILDTLKPILLILRCKNAVQMQQYKTQQYNNNNNNTITQQYKRHH